uniref:Transmembrane protein n=1 Tax=Strongyloides venezuelensis TaxID=75913 RepID=A0A0K0FRP9_STRVS
MKSFKSFIILKFILSIFLSVILISESAPNKIQSQKNNTFLFGNFLCVPCGENDIQIELYEKGQSIRLYYADCKKGAFYITLFSESAESDRFSGSFSQICKQKTKHEKSNVPATFLTTMNQYNFYTFGIINLKDSN